jgi:hypothetical protein
MIRTLVERKLWHIWHTTPWFHVPREQGQGLDGPRPRPTVITFLGDEIAGSAGLVNRPCGGGGDRVWVAISPWQQSALANMEQL